MWTDMYMCIFFLPYLWIKTSAAWTEKLYKDHQSYQSSSWDLQTLYSIPVLITHSLPVLSQPVLSQSVPHHSHRESRSARRFACPSPSEFRWSLLTQHTQLFCLLGWLFTWSSEAPQRTHCKRRPFRRWCTKQRKQGGPEGLGCWRVVQYTDSVHLYLTDQPMKLMVKQFGNKLDFILTHTNIQCI